MRYTTWHQYSETEAGSPPPHTHITTTTTKYCELLKAPLGLRSRDACQHAPSKELLLEFTSCDFLLSFASLRMQSMATRSFTHSNTSEGILGMRNIGGISNAVYLTVPSVNEHDRNKQTKKKKNQKNISTVHQHL